MKPFKYFAIILLLGFSIIACDKDDDDIDNPINNNNTGNVDIRGTWNFLDQKLPDGTTYTFNEYIPFYYTIQGCELLNYRQRVTKSTLDIRTDSSIFQEYERENSSRNILNFDTLNCSIDYSPWSLDTLKVVNDFKAIIGNSQMIFVNIDVINGNPNITYDTNDYQIINNILIINDSIRYLR